MMEVSKAIGQISNDMMTKKKDVKRNCPLHGQYVASIYGWGETKCRTCWEESERLKAYEAARVAAEETRKANMIAAAKRAVDDANIPERFKDRLLSNYVPTCEGGDRALAIAVDYAKSFSAYSKVGRSLIFCGNKGNGKNHLAIGIAHEIMKQGKYPLFISVIDAVRHIKATWNKNSTRTELQAIRDLIEPDLLILDEVGVQFGTESESLLMFDIINGRYNKNKSTIVLSNLTVKEIEGFLGDRAMDRLRDYGGCAVPFTWESFRGKRTD